MLQPARDSGRRASGQSRPRQQDQRRSFSPRNYSQDLLNDSQHSAPYQQYGESNGVYGRISATLGDIGYANNGYQYQQQPAMFTGSPFFPFGAAMDASPAAASPPHLPVSVGPSNGHPPETTYFNGSSLPSFQLPSVSFAGANYQSQSYGSYQQSNYESSLDPFRAPFAQSVDSGSSALMTLPQSPSTSRHASSLTDASRVGSVATGPAAGTPAPNDTEESDCPAGRISDKLMKQLLDVVEFAQCKLLPGFTEVMERCGCLPWYPFGSLGCDLLLAFILSDSFPRLFRSCRSFI